MDYYIAILAALILGFLVVELGFRLFGSRKIVVKIKNKDGSTRLVEINRGRDPEIDRLVKEAKSKKRAAH